MHKTVCLSAICVTVLTIGCTDRREGLGGGAESRMQVTVLRSGGSEGAAVGGAEAVGEKITTFGNFRGKVVVKGAIPTPGLLFTGGTAPDALCRADIPNESVVSGAGNGLANVIVFLRRVPRNVDIPAVPAEPVILDQVGCKFIPRSTVVRVGQPITLKNSDPTTHNVKGNGLSFTINETLGPNSAKDSMARRAEGKPAEIVCNFHSWMRGWVLPLDHPWGAVTSQDGEFEINGVPSGEMEFAVFHEGTQIVGNLKVNIEPDGTVERTIEVDGSQLSVR